MIENAPLNMMYADLDLKIQYMNPTADPDPQAAGAVTCRSRSSR